jgi:Reverse transcriptase (RNA-dependent DNA polymerase)
VLNDQLQDYVDREGLLSDLQSGFRRGHSTTTALVKVTEDLRLSMVDFSKAFDCVSHQLFLSRLASEFQFEATSNRMVASFLADRTMIVEVDGVKSSSRPVLSGAHWEIYGILAS